MIGVEDADEIARTLEPGSCALAVLVEHVWAADAVRAAGRLTAAIRIPAEHVDDAAAQHSVATS